MSDEQKIQARDQFESGKGKGFSEGGVFGCWFIPEGGWQSLDEHVPQDKNPLRIEAHGGKRSSRGKRSLEAELPDEGRRESASTERKRYFRNKQIAEAAFKIAAEATEARVAAEVSAEAAIRLASQATARARRTANDRGCLLPLPLRYINHFHYHYLASLISYIHSTFHVERGRGYSTRNKQRDA